MFFHFRRNLVSLRMIFVSTFTFVVCFTFPNRVFPTRLWKVSLSAKQLGWVVMANLVNFSRNLTQSQFYFGGAIVVLCVVWCGPVSLSLWRKW